MELTFGTQVVITVMSTCTFFLIDLVGGYIKTKLPKNEKSYKIVRRYE